MRANAARAWEWRHREECADDSLVEGGQKVPPPFHFSHRSCLGTEKQVGGNRAAPGEVTWLSLSS